MVSAVIAAVLVLGVLLMLGVPIGQWGAASGTTVDAQEQPVARPAATTPRLNYQGRLLDEDGQPQPDGDYAMSFALYPVADGGSPLWSESKTVTVQDGVFSTLLGDTTVLNTTILNGQELWLGVTVGADPEMTPRQPLAFTPYSVYAMDASTVGGQPASAFAPVDHAHDQLPIAYGYLNRFFPTDIDNTYNVASMQWNSSAKRYEIDVQDDSFSIVGDTVVVSLLGNASSCPAGATVRFGSVSGDLLVYVVDASGNSIECSFNFVVFD
jgi:hypothetical protein